ncbi:MULTISPECIES: DNA/RNA nuclease SfsA [Clostridium]|uniref:Sugar fermentation stimulation protein homolog n=1 Tax=Clostridium aquiflavi TaxID=3073603 RepID=A0ABU1EJP8_9CLOT|nr:MULTISPECIES: DNA/RNA nuclease SfsA [unclassified Clostridium]MDR5588606.1 DNA/RNA nuclease SfsA [Clostridium sp. 5N-1]NFG63231.1 DNA/RNA nuclease SfsA [Clostridium botulinum]NFQ11066.1 DNA/RNA nuclease SfsA [Clostridium botulinum]
MIFKKNTQIVEFVRRPNRFQGYVIIDGKEELVHVPNTGRCKEILIPGCKALIREENGPNRKTKFSLIGAYKGDKLINIDSQIPNKVVEEALINKRIKGLEKYTKISREKTFGNSRFDFKLEDSLNNEYYLEVKGVTLEEDGFCRFPDAPTERGTKHLLELIEVKNNNMGAGVLFLIQLDNVKSFSPNDDTDPKFANALRKAKTMGVDIFVYDCTLGETFIELSKAVELKLQT